MRVQALPMILLRMVRIGFRCNPKLLFQTIKQNRMVGAKHPLCAPHVAPSLTGHVS